MHPSGNSLNNANLDEAPLIAALYNELPHIDDMRDAATKHAKAHTQLLGLIASHGLSQHFSIHLIHKHFNIPDDRVMVYETVRGSTHPGFVLCSPRPSSTVRDLRGLYFRASEGGKMTAYEYTTELGDDLSAHADFVSKFAGVVLDLGVQNIFALTAGKLPGDVLTEFEISDLLSTVLVSNCTWLPSDSQHSTRTDWMAPPDFSSSVNMAGDRVPGIVSLKCIRERAGKHRTVTKKKGEASPSQSKTAMADELFLDGQRLDKGSEAYRIICQASAHVEARLSN